MPTNISAWITTVSKNTATDHLRKIQRNNHLLNHLQQEAIFHNCSEWNPESEALLKQMIEYVQNALNEMDPNTKKIILLRQQGLSYTEIAQQMNLPKNTVKTKIFRGRKQLMTFLQKNGVFQNDL
jgi:RNA polymerase sigma-70 factor (ECF subfamily)